MLHTFIRINLSRCWLWSRNCVGGRDWEWERKMCEKGKDYLITRSIRALQVHVQHHDAFYNAAQFNLISMRFNFIQFIYLRAVVFMFPFDVGDATTLFECIQQPCRISYECLIKANRKELRLKKNNTATSEILKRKMFDRYIRHSNIYLNAVCKNRLTSLWNHIHFTLC